ncbi:MAG: 4-vinyl reductase [Candidatus Altiarchaeota archaeon]
MENKIIFLANDITQKTLQIWKGKSKKIRPKLDDYVHLSELQNILVGCLLFTPGMRAALLGAGKNLGRATATYLTLCSEIAKNIEKFRGMQNLEDVKSSEIFKLLKSFFEINKSGILDITEFNERGIAIEIEECAECYGLPKMNEPICYFAVGYLSGLISVFMNKEVRAYERKCYSNGDEKCEIFIEFVK